MKKGTKMWVFLFFFLLLLSLWLIIGILKVYGDNSLSSIDEIRIFPKMILDLIFKPEHLTDSETLEIKNSLQSYWGSSYSFTSQERWKAIMSMADDQRKLEILLLWLEIKEQEQNKKTDGKIDKIQSSVDGSREVILKSQEVWGLAILKAVRERDKEIVQLKGEIAARDDLLNKAAKRIAELLLRIQGLEKQSEEKPDAKSNDNQTEIEQLKAEIERLKKELANQPQSEPVWPEEEKGPGNFWAGFGVLAGEKVYTNPLGVMADFTVFHTRPGLFFYVDAGLRKFLIKDFLAIQVFGGVGSVWFAGVGAVGFIKPLDISVSAGVQYLPDYLIGNLKSVQVYAELTHEGRWTRMSLRVVPWISLAQLSVGVKF